MFRLVRPGPATIAAAFGAFSLLLNRELLPHLTRALPGNAGDPMLNAWILGWVSEAVVWNPVHLWDAPIFHPHANALAFSEHLLGIALFVAPIYWVTGNAVLTYNVAFLAGYAFIGVAMFLLVRAITGRTDAGLVAGVIVMCSPYLVSSQVARLQMLSAGWSVLTFFWLHRLLETGRREPLMAFTACWAMQMLSNVYLGVFLAVPVGVLLLVAFARRRPALTWRLAGGLAVAAVVLLAINAAPLLRYAQAQRELGLGHSLDEVRRYSASLRSYASVLPELDTTWLWHEDSSDRALFPGALIAILAVVGAAAIARRARTALSRPGHEPGVYVLIAVVVCAFTLGPEPAVSTTPIGIGSPYALVMDLIPGFDGFRAPGRFAVFVVIALGVLAGVGAAAALAGRSRRVRYGVLAAVTAFSLWDGHRNYDWLALVDDEDPSDTAAYAWLAAQPKAAVLELPVVSHLQAQRPHVGGSVTLRYQLAALRHGHVLVNGSSGFVTPLVSLLQSPASPFTTLDTIDDALRILRAIGTRYVVAHKHEYLPDAHEHVDGVQAAMRADTTQVEDVREFGSTVVITLRPAPPATAAEPPRRLASDLFDVTASHNGDLVPRLTDGDLDTRWTAPQQGRSWVEIQMRRARLVSGVKLSVPRVRAADYPHYLRVVGTGTDGTDHVLFDGAAVYDTAMTAVFEPARPGLRLIWTPVALSRVRLEQPQQAGDLRWAIYELEVHTDGDRLPIGDD